MRRCGLLARWKMDARHRAASSMLQRRRQKDEGLGRHAKKMVVLSG